MIAWALGYGEHARIAGPAGARGRGARAARRDRRAPHAASRSRASPRAAPPGADDAEAAEPPTRSRQEAAIRPERFARLVTLASVLIAAGREGRRLPVAEVCDQLQISEQELREDISVLNVVNFGGGAYVLYAEVQGNEIEVDPEPYSDTFDRPARLLPIEANALIAAIDLLGDAPARAPRHRARRRSTRRSARPAARGCRSRAPAATTPTSRASSAARSRRAT